MCSVTVPCGPGRRPERAPDYFPECLVGLSGRIKTETAAAFASLLE